jgi:(1->4)-alpha-D-glucan 1-alpha-D-glucosylmutase
MGASEAAAPARCYLPPAVSEGRIWGFAVQLYGLRSERNWGIGDFSDLTQLVELAAQLGAGFVMLSPLHALFPRDPERASPYSPSSRLRLNVLYLDIEAIEDCREDEAAQGRLRDAAFRARLARLRAAPLVDYSGVAAAKLEILESLYAGFRSRHLAHATARAAEFRAFQAQEGESLRRHALFEARQDRARTEFYEYLQWQAERQLARASERCRELGLAVGLCLDVAVSADRDGAEIAASPEDYAREASIGAPPDAFNPLGQDWGLPPPLPERQRAQGYRGLIELLRASMRHAGAVRIDHVMALMRLYWVPLGKTAREGAYVHYALEEQLQIVARESVQNRCLVIGEDLGTVADEMRAAMARHGVLSYRLLFFERRADGAFKPPADYPRDALAAVSTHDLPTLAGWWRADDLELRRSHGFFADEAGYRAAQAERETARAQLLDALRRAGTLAQNATETSVSIEQLCEAAHAYLAATPARLVTVQLEDALGVTEQANLPGTTSAHPNWRRKLPETLEDLARSERLRDLAIRVRARRENR